MRDMACCNTDISSRQHMVLHTLVLHMMCHTCIRCDLYQSKGVAGWVQHDSQHIVFLLCSHVPPCSTSDLWKHCTQTFAHECRHDLHAYLVNRVAWLFLRRLCHASEGPAVHLCLFLVHCCLIYFQLFHQCTKVPAVHTVRILGVLGWFFNHVV